MVGEILPSRELTYPPDKAYLKMIFPFPQVGYVNSLEGIPFWREVWKRHQKKNEIWNLRRA